MTTTPFAELCCRSNFSFLEGASRPEELVDRAAALGLSGLAITDRDSLAGVVRAHQRARETGVALVVGAEVSFVDHPPLVLLAMDAQGYGNLCELLSIGRLSDNKGSSFLPWARVADRAAGLWAIDLMDDGARRLAETRELFGGRLHVAVWNHRVPDAAAQLELRAALAARAGVPVLATNRPVMHQRARQRLQDVLTCIGHRTTLREAGDLLFPNGERCLKGAAELQPLLGGRGDWLEEATRVASECRFSLDSLQYDFPQGMLGAGESPMAMLRRLVDDGLAQRYPHGVPPDVRGQVVHELSLVEELGFAGYFLTVWEIVRFARSRGILCQGRGSAANSVLCYALGITRIDPVRMGLLFERFISRERREPPDIDVDFEHERREEVLQFVYERYGRDRAAMVAEVICFRGRSALREVGRVMGLSSGQQDALSATAGPFGAGPDPEALRRSGLALDAPEVRLTLELAEELQDFPRHLGIHSGGFVVTHQRLARLVPLEQAAMEGRTVLQWDKDDAAAVGLLKIDLLSLGMLSMLARALTLLRRRGESLSLDDIPAEDPAVYDMLCEGDSVGVFQVESRAQMNMLPRLRPRCFYDLVVQVAIIRPGPIQGGMVHPYLRRRAGLEAVRYPHPAVRDVLEKTLGVTLFQEQGMRLAVAAAGFTPGEADELRRAMTHKRSRERLAALRDKLLQGMAARGIAAEDAEQIYQQLLGFSGYGFPESHSASFALLVYASAWLKRYHPGLFAASLLNSLPMGFYAPHTIVEDARRHGVPPRPVDVFYSEWETTLEEAEEGEGVRPADEAHRGWRERRRHEGRVALRLGLSLVRGLRREHAEAVVRARREREFASLPDLARRTGLSRAVLGRLAAAGALDGFGLGRRAALWEVHRLETGPRALLAGVDWDEPEVTLEEPSRAERMGGDYARLGLSADDHPMALLRPRLAAERYLRSDQLARTEGGRRVRVAGLCIVRQRPGTARGLVFVTLEDEAGFINLVVMPDLWEKCRFALKNGLFWQSRGTVQRSGRVVTVKASTVELLEEEAASVATQVRDFR